MDINNEKYKMLDTESEEDYQIRICGYHDTDRLTWTEIAGIINSETDNNYSETKYRKFWKFYNKGREDAEAEIEFDEDSVSPEIGNLIEERIALEKEKIKVSDERNQTRAYLRRIAREETLKEIASTVAKEMNGKKLLPVYENKATGDKEAILEISDWHYGICASNYWNEYNPDVAKERISKLYAKAKAFCLANKVKVLHVVNLSDLIAGRIHFSIRVESRFDVITQVMQVSEILAEMLNKFTKDFEVHYYDCLDNHSRLEPNKHDAMELETLARIIPWYLKERIGNQINIHDNMFGEDIITFNIKDYKILGVHGDKDKPNTVVDNLSMMTHQHYDLVLTAHLHHFSADEKNETMVVSNGSLMGTDTYAKNLRLSSKPSQNLIIVSDESVAECIYRIVL